MSNFPDTFSEWIRTPAGRGNIEWASCLSNAKDAQQYLYNRAYHAFQAGVKFAPRQMQLTFEWYEERNRKLQAEIKELKKQLHQKSNP